MAFQQTSDLSEAGQGEDVQTCQELILAVLLEHAQLSTHAIYEHVSAVFPLGRLAGGRGERDALQFLEDCLVGLEESRLVRRLPAGFILTPEGEQLALSDPVEKPALPPVPGAAGPEAASDQSLEDILASLRRDMASAGGIAEEPPAPVPVQEEVPRIEPSVADDPAQQVDAIKHRRLPDPVPPPAPPAPAPVAQSPVGTETDPGVPVSGKTSSEEPFTKVEGPAAEPVHQPPALGTDETLAPTDAVVDQVEADDMFEPAAPPAPKPEAAKRKRATPAKPVLDVSAIQSQIEQLDLLEVDAELEAPEPSPAPPHVAPPAPELPCRTPRCHASCRRPADWSRASSGA